MTSAALVGGGEQAGPSSQPVPTPAQEPADGHALPAPGCGPGDVRLIPDFVDGRASDALLAAVLGRTEDGAPPSVSIPTTPGWTHAAGRAVRSYGGTVVGASLIPAALPAWAASLFDRLVADAGLDFSGGGGGGGGEAGKAGAPPPPARPNHVLANAYPRGAGILPHTDGPAYAPLAAILSLGDDSPGVMRFHRAAGEAAAASTSPAFSVFLPPRSLLVFSGDAYSAHLHGLDTDTVADEIDGSVLNADAARAWVAARGGGGGRRAPPASAATTTIPRGPCRVSLTVRRVLRVKKGLLRL